MPMRLFLAGSLLLAGTLPTPGALTPTHPAVPAAPAPAPEAMPQEEQRAPIVGIGAHLLEDQDLESLNELGVRHVRHTLYATLWEIDPGYRSEWEERVRIAAAGGIRLLVVVHQIPPAWTPITFSRWIGDRAAQLPVEAWQIGNEVPFPDHLEWHRRAFAEIKRRRPEALVVTLAIPDEAFARAWDAPTDAFAVHVYGLPLEGVLREKRDWFPSAAEVWITEFGIERKVVPAEWGDWELVQAREWEAALTAGASYQRLYGYQLRTEEPLDTHGLVRPDGSYRPAALRLREWMRTP